MTPSGRNGATLFVLVACVAVMAGLAYASVPLYRLFCQATGFGGTTQRVADAPASPRERWVTISFDGNVDSGLPWDFTPTVKSLRVRLGEIVTVSYLARNHGPRAAVGTATFNVQPDKVGGYFDKIQCFCFSRQELEPGQAAELPVQFYVDPAMADDRQTEDVRNITLSYTFFPAKDQGGVAY